MRQNSCGWIFQSVNSGFLLSQHVYLFLKTEGRVNIIVCGNQQRATNAVERAKLVLEPGHSFNLPKSTPNSSDYSFM